jgi:hypothetical protein
VDPHIRASSAYLFAKPDCTGVGSRQSPLHAAHPNDVDILCLKQSDILQLDRPWYHG